MIGIVESLSKSVGAKISRNEIKDIYRVRGKNAQILSTPIIVETTSTLLKTDILMMCKQFNVKNKAKLRGMHVGIRAAPAVDAPIYVSEHLTPKGSRLHFLARDLAKSKNYKFCWTAYGKVYLRKDENSPIIAIKSEAQVQHLLQGQK